MNVLEGRRRDSAAEILLNHRQHAAGKIAQAIRQVGVVARDQGFAGKVAVLAEDGFAQQVIAQRVVRPQHRTFTIGSG